MNQAIKETLEKQLQILSERSIRERGELVPDLTRAMISVAQFLNDDITPFHDLIVDTVTGEVNRQLDERDTALAESLLTAAKEQSNRSEKDFEELTELCRPVVEYIQKKWHPHTRIIIDWDRASIFTEQRGVSFQVPD